MTLAKPLIIVHTESSCGWGGQEIRILNEAQGLLERGHQVHLLCVDTSNIYREAQKRGIPATVLPIGRKNIKGLLALRQWFESHPVDVVNTHSSTDSWLTALARIGLSKKLPVVRTRHISARIAPGAATRWLYQKGCEFVVTTGEQLRDYVMAQTGLPSTRVRSIPTGIDTHTFVPGDRLAARQALGLPLDKTIIGIVATIRTWKGHVYLLEAIARLQSEDVYILIVGEGPNQLNVQAAVIAQQLQDKVRFAGQQANVVPWLQAMDIFALPSYANEGVPQSLMQAMLCGIAVVSTPVGSIGELVKPAVTGLVVEPKSAPALAAVLQQLLDDPALKQRLADNARQHALHHCSLDSMLTQMEEVFLSQIR